MKVLLILLPTTSKKFATSPGRNLHLPGCQNRSTWNVTRQRSTQSLWVRLNERFILLLVGMTALPRFKKMRRVDRRAAWEKSLERFAKQKTKLENGAKEQKIAAHAKHSAKKDVAEKEAAESLLTRRKRPRRNRKKKETRTF
ncbi:hypothetical protein K470DRAFT_267047 [Piedraia hortae CBS 480.64]|uniref:Uncharacterized protein n=1 Tax=Piedraia hortae CBS 480.64 TaxID=1314780 RepID=A0A6A7BQT7_9PEZI|nr:hypothetical protein K470DRAFT_267047 [Piedraia hortae CBS 480.64]